ncbi:hypothetical protein FIBSPDRAFT_847176 [Athelia psychrophila]|uniref:Uncharacterized protein n=1 Tax=Athelia psychrophila TaxID=1759441 RepID=A0A166WRR8_9AGAM|nr:hypothetical protein FIBSPDRAFT_869214 [Fibularhizoctonia sp. CBS 109695]KZP34037.1 hypothetical protein FIBSPDRAFT_847176 [Fibularhizoctonia sp. CBS 109695]
MCHRTVTDPSTRWLKRKDIALFGQNIVLYAADTAETRPPRSTSASCLSFPICSCSHPVVLHDRIAQVPGMMGSPGTSQATP